MEQKKKRGEKAKGSCRISAPFRTPRPFSETFTSLTLRFYSQLKSVLLCKKVRLLASHEPAILLYFNTCLRIWIRIGSSRCPSHQQQFVVRNETVRGDLVKAIPDVGGVDGAQFSFLPLLLLLLKNLLCVSNPLGRERKVTTGRREERTGALLRLLWNHP